ncbi:MAG: TonB-dependent receptor, partial [Acidobacteriaceae bacterium]|nr:TonB-dependent receptor [Acidobacteriaceae bacterium]
PDTKSGGYVSFIPPQDSLQEFRVQTNAYDASIGRQAGGTVNMQTKSGTADYHGTLYEYNQNSVFNANFFQTNASGGAVPPIHFNEYGGTIGGPVWIPKVYNGKQRTFFFVSYDRTKNIDPRTGGTRSVPTALERTGDFTQSFTVSAGVRYPIVVYDPRTVDRSTSTGIRQPFPGDKIPANRLDPVALNILKFLPLPNTPSAPGGNASLNFISAATRQDDFPVLSIRADENWNNSNKSFVTLRWSHLTESLDNYYNDAATGNHMQRIAKSAGFDHVWTVSATKILDLRFTLNRFEEPSYSDGAGFDPTQLGFPASFVKQMVKPSFPYITGFGGNPTDNPVNFGAGNAGSYTNNTYYTWLASLTHVYGNHTFRYGAEYWVLQQANAALGNQGRFDFNNVWTRRQATQNNDGPGSGSTFGSFLLGLPSGGSFPVNDSAIYSQRFAGLYFQDDWRVGKRLTLNLGLRWDYERPITERFDRLTTNYDPNFISPISAQTQAAYAAILNNPTYNNPSNSNYQAIQLLKQILPASAFQVRGAQLFAGVNGQSREAYHPDWHEWQPRVGFAYQIRPTTVFRGGFGRFTQASFEYGNADSQDAENGFSRTTPLLVTKDNNFTPFDTLSNPFSTGIFPPTGSSLGPLTNLGQGFTWMNQDLNRIYSWEYSFHLQQQIKTWLFEIGYSHNKTYNIYQTRNVNLPSFALWQQLHTPQFDASGKPNDTLLWDTNVPNPFNGIPNISGGIGSSGSISINQIIRPIALLGDRNRTNDPVGTNQYDAMLVKVEHRFSKGFSVINSFTWSKLFEDTSLLGPQNAGIYVEHKLGGEDHPLVLSIAPIWEVPFGRGKRWGSNLSKPLDLLLGGWELSGQYTAERGTPVAFTATDNFFFTGNDFSLPNDQRTLDHWFDTSQFYPFPTKATDLSTVPDWVKTILQNYPGYNYKPTAADLAAGIHNGVYQDFATYVRRIPTRWGDVREPGINEFNVGLYKNFKITESTKVQLRFDAFNALNHPRFGAPNADPRSGDFGRITATQQNNPRQIELAGKIVF